MFLRSETNGRPLFHRCDSSRLESGRLDAHTMNGLRVRKRTAPEWSCARKLRPADPSNSSSMVVLMSMWDADADGVLRLPSGRLVLGRGLRRPLPDGGGAPEFGLYLLGDQPETMTWEARWVRWPDFRLPTNRHDVRQALWGAWRRATSERVEIACGGGRGRTGAALACLAVLDGLPAHEAVAYVRQRYHPRAVETPWQRRYVAQFPASKDFVP